MRSFRNAKPTGAALKAGPIVAAALCCATAVVAVWPGAGSIDCSPCFSATAVSSPSDGVPGRPGFCLAQSAPAQAPGSWTYSAAGADSGGVASADSGGAVGSSGAGGARDEGQEHWLKRAGRVALSAVGRAVLYVVLLVGLVLIPFGLGGTFVMVGAAAVYGLLTGFDQITLKLVAVLLGLALVGEGIESLLGVVMARRYGASKWGMWGAFLGGIAGALLGAPVPVIGNVVGALVGVFLGAFVLEWIGQGRSGASLRAGWGALLGRTAAGVIKIALGMVIMILIISRTLS